MDTKNLYLFVSTVPFFIIMITISRTSTLGFDSGIGGSCSQKMSRQGRAQFLQTIPCDLTKQTYCNLPGASYPWHAVRRFVHENQGLMKRMYGDIHHISVLRNEIQKNDIDTDESDVKSKMEFFTEDEGADSQEENIRRAKYLQSMDFQHSKLSQYGIGGLSQPHFRPTSSLASSNTNHNAAHKPTKATVVNFNESAKHMHSSDGEKFVKKKKTQNHEAEKREDEATAATEKTPKNDESNNDESNDVYDTNNQIEENKIAITNLAIANKNKNEIDGKNIITNGDNALSNDNNGVEKQIAVNEIENKSENITSISATLNVVKQIIETEMQIEAEEKKNDENIQIESKHNSSPEKVNTTSLANILLEKFQLKLLPSSTIVETTTSKAGVLKANQTEKPVLEEDKAESTTTETNDQKSKEKLLDNDKNKVGGNKTNVLGGQLFQDTVQKDPSTITNVRGVNACPTKEEVVAPFWANNTRGEVLALLNLYPFEQYVHWERCTNEHKQMYCRDGCRCEQQYSLHRLLAYDPHDECRGIFSDWFRFPSCCICKCYNIPLEVRTTSRSPRSDANAYENKLRLIDIAEAEAHRAVYDHAIEDWYRPQDNLD